MISRFFVHKSVSTANKWCRVANSVNFVQFNVVSVPSGWIVTSAKKEQVNG